MVMDEAPLDRSAFMRGLKGSLHLHCRSLTLTMPGSQPLTFVARLPPHMQPIFQSMGCGSKATILPFNVLSNENIQLIHV